MDDFHMVQWIVKFTKTSRQCAIKEQSSDSEFIKLRKTTRCQITFEIHDYYKRIQIDSEVVLPFFASSDKNLDLKRLKS